MIKVKCLVGAIVISTILLFAMGHSQSVEELIQQISDIHKEIQNSAEKEAELYEKFMKVANNTTVPVCQNVSQNITMLLEMLNEERTTNQFLNSQLRSKERMVSMANAEIERWRSKYFLANMCWAIALVISIRLALHFQRNWESIKLWWFLRKGGRQND